MHYQTQLKRLVKSVLSNREITLNENGSRLGMALTVQQTAISGTAVMLQSKHYIITLLRLCNYWSIKYDTYYLSLSFGDHYLQTLNSNTNILTCFSCSRTIK